MANLLFLFITLIYSCTSLAVKQNVSSIDILFGPGFRITRLRTPYYKNGDGIVQGARSCGIFPKKNLKQINFRINSDHVKKSYSF